MDNKINFAIDLGTTNSVISCYNKGEIDIFKNPTGQKETLPSVVAFRKNRTIVGEKAREHIEKDPQNVIGLFKRKMGTDHTYRVEVLDKNVTPIELSSLVLKELKNFVTVTPPKATVITIPASFDTIQSNATKKAGELAGFEQVDLLQEPIAASLAFINKYETDAEDKTWLVYDLGGGTFDIALVQINEGELKIIDHNGDNFLGGQDFDNIIFEKILLPKLIQEGTFPKNVLKEFKSASGSYHKHYYKLLKVCEELKISLSRSESAELEFEIQDENDNWVDFYAEVSRNEFDSIITPVLLSSINLVKELLKRNTQNIFEVASILLIGGSTYIPLVSILLKEHLNIKVDARIDPISAVSVGASYYASTKSIIRKKTPETPKEENNDYNLEIKQAYQKQSQLNEEYFTAIIKGDVNNLSYRITRKDGGYDSGIKPLSTRIEEDLSLLPKIVNQFDFVIYDEHQNKINVPISTIEIAQGKHNILGQPIPEDICLEIDDIDDNNTGLQVIFKKNDLLPLRKTITKEVSQTIVKSGKESILINLLEGPQHASPSSNKPIGFIEIKSEDLDRDLIKGTDVEITIEMSESRDITIKAYLSFTDQEFNNVFSPSNRYVNVGSLKEEVFILMERIVEATHAKQDGDDYEALNTLQGMEKIARQLYQDVDNMADDDVTDTKYQIEDSKRKISHQLDSLDNNSRIEALIEDANDWVRILQNTYNEATGVKPDQEKRYNNIIKNAPSTIQSGNRVRIKRFKEEITDLNHQMSKDNPEYITSLFYHYAYLEDGYPSKKAKEKLVKEGEKAIEKENYILLKTILNSLAGLLPEEKKDFNNGKSTGIN